MNVLKWMSSLLIFVSFFAREMLPTWSNCPFALLLTNNNAAYSLSLPFVSFSGWYGEEKYFGIENDFKIIVLKDRKTLIK